MYFFNFKKYGKIDMIIITFQNIYVIFIFKELIKCSRYAINKYPATSK